MAEGNRKQRIRLHEPSKSARAICGNSADAKNRTESKKRFHGVIEYRGNIALCYHSKAMTTTHRATIEDLYRVKGKAELVNGEIAQMPPTGYLPGYAATEIVFSLRLHERATG